MPKSYRIRTKLGVDQNIRVKIDQDFDFLEVLSLKLRQEDVYTKFCADYGVVVGRVVANGGFGIPNARVSIFVPVEDIDLENPVISALYPYKSPEDKNEDGYRYNLLPYEKEYGGHTPTGTFPTRQDVLTRSEVLEIYDKYYKFTVKTNESGDFMIVGVPLGVQTAVLDLDLSNIGCFSLRPVDLIRMGLGTEEQFNGNQFKSSENIDSLPQIIHQTKNVDVSSFWGEGDICDVGITRVDFDLRNLGVEITPTSVFMGSIMSSNDSQMLKKNCKPKTNQGNLCGMVTGPGEILAIRQTINVDANGDPILEQYKLEQGGKVIDEDGTFVTEVPMNMDYVVTNEFGEQVITNDSRIGIPTTAKYRFKVKYQGEESGGELNPLGGFFPVPGEILRGNFLVPNIKEYGWVGTASNPGIDPATLADDNSPNYDPNYTANTQWQLFQKSYAFSLDWADYANKAAAINCDDTFYKMKYNKVYTTSQFIDEYRRGTGRARFLGIKEIIDDSCEGDTNKFPTNDGVRSFDFIYFLFNYIMTLMTPTFFLLILLVNIICILWPILRVLINIVGTVILTQLILICNVVKFLSFGLLKINCPKWQLVNIDAKCPLSSIPLPNLSYPDCNACSCESRDVVGDDIEDTNFIANNSLLINSGEYMFFEQIIAQEKEDNSYVVNSNWMSKDLYGFQNTMSGFDNGTDNDIWTKAPFMDDQDPDGNPYTGKKTYSLDLPLSERLNLFNVKSKYHTDSQKNRIKVQVNPNANGSKYHYDNVLAIVCDPNSEQTLAAGTIVTFQNINNSADPNISGGTTGTSVNNTTVAVSYMNPGNLGSNITTFYNITGDTANTNKNKYLYPSDVEYFQVITATTVGDYVTTASPYGASPGFSEQGYGYGNDKFINRFLFGYQRVERGGIAEPNVYPDGSGNNKFKYNYPNLALNSEYKNHVIVFLVRGVDMYTDRQDTIFDLSALYGANIGVGPQVRGNYKMNIPIQKYTNSSDWRITRHNLLSNNGSNAVGKLFYGSYTFTVGTNYVSYSTKNHLDYSSLDSAHYKVGNTGNPDPGTSSDFTTINLAVATTQTGTYDRMVNHNNQIHSFENGYKNQEVVEGGTVMMCKDGVNPQRNDYRYYSPTYYITDPSSTLSMSNTTNIIMRSDRLPTSDVHDRRFVLHQNKDFAIYTVSDLGTSSQTTPTYTTGTDNFNNAADDFAEDAGNMAATILQTFACETMVPLGCYTGNGENFGVAISTDDCYYVNKKDDLKKMYGGCYYLAQKPGFAGIVKDIQLFTEWRSRFRMMFALCRGAVGLSFVNNWINGSLYMFSFQKDTLYLSPLSASTFNSDVTYRYCIDNLVFKETNNSFFYRSSPFNGTVFTGKNSPLKNNGDPYPASAALNNRLLGYPTTMMDLGPRDQFTKEICFNPDFEGFIIDKVRTTSYNDTSDILQLFVISRLTDANFLEQLVGLGDGSVSKLFSRENSRIDGDIAQLLSINSEFGVTPYLGDNYGDSNIKYLSSSDGPVLGIFFTGNTQNRDLITPGRTTFADNTIVYLTNYYGFEDQQVPYHPWKIQSNGNIIFGNQLNDWNTKTTVDSTINTIYYQGVDRLIGGQPSSGQPTFPSEVATPTTQKPGFIYNSSSTGGINPTIDVKTTIGTMPTYIMEGSPYHFYFGLRIGKSAMNKYITKYIFNEDLI